MTGLPKLPEGLCILEPRRPHFQRRLTLSAQEAGDIERSSDTFRWILASVAERTRVPATMILSRSRIATHALARYELAESLHGSGWSYPRIARALGMDHTSVMYAVRRARGESAAQARAGLAPSDRHSSPDNVNTNPEDGTGSHVQVGGQER